MCVTVVLKGRASDRLHSATAVALCAARAIWACRQSAAVLRPKTKQREAAAGCVKLKMPVEVMFAVLAGRHIGLCFDW